MIKEFTEPDRVRLSQGLVSVFTATTNDSEKIREAFERNSEEIEKYRIPPQNNVLLKIFNIFWNSIPCGQIILQIDKETKSHALVSYWVDKQLSGKQIGTTSLSLIKTYAFGVLHLNYLEAYVQPENIRSIRVLEKAKFHKTETLYQAKSPEGTPISHLVYKVTSF